MKNRTYEELLIPRVEDSSLMKVIKTLFGNKLTEREIIINKILSNTYHNSEIEPNYFIEHSGWFKMFFSWIRKTTNDVFHLTYRNTIGLLLFKIRKANKKKSVKLKIKELKEFEDFNKTHRTQNTTRIQVPHNEFFSLLKDLKHEKSDSYSLKKYSGYYDSVLKKADSIQKNKYEKQN